MTCPICSGAFSWKDGLLHHLGAVHHLEELIAHLESEFTRETCPPCCRVPQTLFKSLLQEPTSCMLSVRGTDTVQCKQEKELSYAEHSHADLPVQKMHATQANVDGASKMSDITTSTTSPRHKSSDSCVRPIERYHCDLCEFSANDIRQLVEHGSEHQSRETPVQLTRDEQVESVVEEMVDDYSIVSPRKPTEEMYFCDACPFSTKWQKAISQHIKAHKRSALVKVGYKCAYCNVASVFRGSVYNHQTACHQDQPTKIVHIEDGKVVEGSDSCKTVTPESSPSSSGSAGKKQSKLNQTWSQFIDVGSNSRPSQKKTPTKKQSTSPSSSSTREVSSSAKELTEVLESKLPEHMIYRRPVCCPACDFSNRIRINLVRHIRLSHGNHRQQSQTRLLKSCPSGLCGSDDAHVDPAKPTSVLQVLIMKL